jgi:hypothetical protein
MVKYVERLQGLCLWVGGVSLTAALIVSIDRAREVISVFGGSLGVTWSLHRTAVDLYPLLLTFVPLAVWSMLTVLCKMHREVLRNTTVDDSSR